jgi:hypothetical protein
MAGEAGKSKGAASLGNDGAIEDARPFEFAQSWEEHHSSFSVKSYVPQNPIHVPPKSDRVLDLMDAHG